MCITEAVSNLSILVAWPATRGERDERVVGTRAQLHLWEQHTQPPLTQMEVHMRVEGAGAHA